MNDYRLTLSLSEAAEVLGTDITAILEQNSLDPSYCMLPRVGIESEPYGYGYVFNTDKLNKKLSDYINGGEQQSELKYLLQSTVLGTSAYSDGEFFYLHKRDIDNIRRNGSLSFGGFYEDTDFTTMWTKFLKQSIFVDLPEDKRNREYGDFDGVKTIFEENNYVSYTTPNKKEITINDLRMRASDVKAFIAAKNGDLNHDALQEGVDAEDRFIELEKINAALTISNESLRSRLYEIEKVFGEQIRNHLYPIAMAIHEFSESSVYATILEERGQPDKVNSKGLEDVQGWVKSHTQFKTERRSDFIKDLINAYYKLK